MNLCQFHRFELSIGFFHYLSYLWVFIIINVIFDVSFTIGCRNGVFVCVSRSGVEMNFAHFTPISTKNVTYLYLKLHSPVEVSQLFKCLLTFMVNITIDLVCVCDGIVQYIYIVIRDIRFYCV